MAFRPSHRQLRYFIAIAELGHFGAAAKACHVSQPTLSAQLKLLEEQLGAPLIDRAAGKAKPTPVGLSILPMARMVLTTLDEITAAASLGAGNLGGLIRMGVAPTFGPYALPRILPHLHSAHPGLEVYIREERPSALEAALAEGALDCILTPLPVLTDRFDRCIVCEEEIFLGIPGEHRLGGETEVAIEDLAGERLLTLGRGHRLYDQVQQLCEASGAHVREDYEGTSLDALRQMVSIGMGLSLFPAIYVAFEFPKESMVTLAAIRNWPVSRQVCLAWRRDSVRAAHFRQLANEARRALKTLEHVRGIAIPDGDA